MAEIIVKAYIYSINNIFEILIEALYEPPTNIIMLLQYIANNIIIVI